MDTGERWTPGGEIGLWDDGPLADYETSSSVPAPSSNVERRRLERYSTRTVKVKLVQGSVLSIDYPVPSAIQNELDPRYLLDFGEEFTHMRYTAATCDPNEFTLKNAYNLRPAMYNRHTELLIAVTCFNENKVMLSRTLHAVMENVRDICKAKGSKFWDKGGPAWHKIVVCLIFDGIDSCDGDVLDVLATVGVYQDGVMKKSVDGRETVAHIFEYTTQLSVTESQQLMRPPHFEKGGEMVPVQMILCIKQQNTRKINSHRWLYNAFGRILNPEVVAIIDVGTKPGKKSILALWSAFYNDSNLGGASGNIHTMGAQRLRGILNPLVAAQNFEYKTNVLLDKPLESVFGYLTVLPGAFSAYRFRAIMGSPLERYLHGDHTLSMQLGREGLDGMNIFSKNLFLTEDRVMGFEIVTKPGSRWHLGYVKSATAETNTPEHIPEFIMQRSRWLNGAFASTLYSLIHFTRIYKSSHSVIRIALFHIQMLYSTVSFVLAWFSLATFLLTTFIIMDITGSPPPESTARAFPFGSATPIFNAVVQCLYICFVLFQFILALGNNVRSERFNYLLSFLVFGFVQLYSIINVLYLLVRIFMDDQSQDSSSSGYAYISTFYSSVGPLVVWITCGSVFGVYYAISFLYLDPWHLFISFPQYLFVLSAYTNIINVYAFSNWSDVSWVLKGKYKTMASSLPTARIDPRYQTLEEEDPSQADIDNAFEIIVKRALAPYVETEVRDTRNLEESDKSFRTKLVAVYIFSNFFLCILVMNESFDKLDFLGDSYSHKVWFFRIWMWSTSGCFLLRFVGSCIFLIQTIWGRCFERI